MIKFFLKRLRLLILQNQREIKLSLIFNYLIKKYRTSRNIRILDFGSGFEPRIASYIKSTLEKEIKIEITCIDLYSKKDLNILHTQIKLKLGVKYFVKLVHKIINLCIIQQKLKKTKKKSSSSLNGYF